MQPWSFPSRRFQGAYFRWALDRVIASAPDEVAFVEHVGVVAVLEGSATSPQRLVFTDGRRLEADVVVLLQGC
jgi:FAD-NAD(P)-binding